MVLHYRSTSVMTVLEALGHYILFSKTNSFPYILLILSSKLTVADLDVLRWSCLDLETVFARYCGTIFFLIKKEVDFVILCSKLNKLSCDNINNPTTCLIILWGAQKLILVLSPSENS